MRNHLTTCEIKVCGDGQKHEGFFCGKGPCNVVGCACEGGCIEGDAATNFLAYRNNHVVVDSAGPDKLDGYVNDAAQLLC